MSNSLEYCCACDSPTGRAGQGEDSLYTDNAALGPFCEECWGDTQFWRERTDKLLTDNEKLRASITEWLPIIQGQLDNLLRSAKAQDEARSLFLSTANARVDRMRAALE